MSMAGLVARKGAPVVFTSSETASTGSTYDGATDTSTITPATPGDQFPGNAMEIDGDPELYKALSLIESENPTLLFTPTTVGSIPPLGAFGVWGGNTYTIKNRKFLAMNGIQKAARLVVGR
jgi:hypothetical protein